jgi:TnpA family transposase
MPRMRILSKTEQEQFEKPPVFGAQQRKTFLTFSKYLLETAKTFRKTDYQIGFLLACGYFNSTKCFFAPKDYHRADIKAVSRYLNIEYKGFDATSYPARTKQRHEHIILEFYGFKRFDNSAEVLLSKEIGTMVYAHPKPRLIFERCLDILVQNRIQLPSSRTLTDLVKTGLSQHKTELSKLVEVNLSDKERKLLDELFTQSITDSTDEMQPINARYKLTLLKRISQSAKPTKIKERVHDFQLLKNLYQNFIPVMSEMKLTDDGIRYYAGSVLKSEIFQLTRRSDEDRYLHAIAFIIHQYYRLQDNLVDVLLGAVQTSQNSAKREHKEQVYNQRKTQETGFSSLLLRLGSDLDMLGKIRGLAHDGQLDDNQIVQKIRHVLAGDKESELSKIKEELETSLKGEVYYDVLENRSMRLQNKVSPIFKALSFKAQASAASLLEAIEYFKDKDGNIIQTAPLDFLEAKELKAIMDENDQKLRVSLYKSFLFIHVASAIKSGNLNLEQSYKYRPMDDYLIDRVRWKNDRDELLKRAELTQFTNPEKIFKELDKSLYQQYKTTNNNENSGNNPHLKIAASGSYRIVTPAIDDHDSQPLQPFFPKRHIVPLTEILATVNQYSGFLGEFGHWQQQHARKTVSHRTLYAGIMGLGCNIGTRKMAQISPLVKEDELENTINWRFSQDNLQEANDRILKATDAMELPKHYQRTHDKLHTSSDGQKFEVRTDSLNANHSFKYFGKGQGVSVYTFIDERNLLWHSTVISASERESAYVIDGLMHNDVVKSGIHSTDTHGYSEVIFAATHLLGFSYAPRIKNLKKQNIYIFRSCKDADQIGWKITPDKYINEKIIKDNWEDFLRLICTIKLKETTASDIFRRINSYSKQHALYKAMKAFGQIIKSLFILRYLNELELRQAIEKQLNKIELANKLTRAVAVGNPREYTQGEKEEQGIAESCNRLIKNAIICWNYLYLTKQLKQAKTEEDREHLLKSIITHSVISWAHINLLGEYDFSDEKLKDTVGILPLKMAA